MKIRIKHVINIKKPVLVFLALLLIAIFGFAYSLKQERTEVSNNQKFESVENNTDKQAPVKSEDLDSCLKRANNSDARQDIIDEWIRNCYEEYN